MSNVNLDSLAENIFETAYDNVKANNGRLTFSCEELEDAIQDAVNEAAGSACIYTADCYEIISWYESQVGDVEDIGDTFKVTEWERAMVLYAGCVAQAYLSQKTQDLAEEMFEEAESLLAFAHEHGADEDLSIEDLRIQNSSSFGWEAHKLEDADGRCYWQGVEGEVDAVESTFQGMTLVLSWSRAG